MKHILCLFLLLIGLNAYAGPAGLRTNHILVVDATTQETKLSSKADVVVPIASITKLMTAIVVLDAKQPMDEIITITTADVDRIKKSHSRLRIGTKCTRRGLLRLALMSSENRAAHALSRYYPGGEAAFVKAMNEKARQLGMTNTHFVEPTGLSMLNKSTAKDLVKLVLTSSQYETITQFSTTAKNRVKFARPGYTLVFQNSSSLVREKQWDIHVSKTGYIREAGYCIVMKTIINDEPVIMVLMKAPSKTRLINDAVRIKQYLTAQNNKTA